MKKVNPGVRVSTYFKLDRDQSTLDFVDVPIGKDVKVYVDPSRLRSIQSPWAAECNSLLQHFFDTLLGHLKAGDDAAGLSMLEHLTEKNEFHLGQSKDLSDGRAFGPAYALKVWNALRNSKARASGLLQDISLEDQKKLQKRCIDTAKDSRGYIVALTDNDLKELVQEYMLSNGKQTFSLLMRKFNALVM